MNGKALLVEDEFLIRELAFEYLSDAGFDTTMANSADQGLSILREDKSFDLLFTDIRMPGGIDGRQLATEASRLVEGIRIVFATGYLDEAVQLEEGQKLIQKPYSMNAVREVLSELGFS